MDEEEEYLFIPTTSQQKIVSLLVIPPSLLSFLGSSFIIYHVVHDTRKSSYRRILFALSVCDIISTLAWISQPYLMRSDAINSYIWSFGNATSCAALGAITQFGISTHLYSGCLSFYFLLTLRFGMKEQTFEKRLEKLMHFVVITFSLGTSAVGLATGMFYPIHVGPGCWISHPPEGGYCANDSCGAEQMAWAFAGFPTLLVIFSIATNNLLLYCYVRSTVVRGRKRAFELEERSSTCNRNQVAALSLDDNDSDIEKPFSRKSVSGWTSFTSEQKKTVLQSSDKQRKRVKQVGTQSFLYVGAYLLCFGCTIVKQALDGQGLDKIEGSGSIFLPLTILQAIFVPAQGFFNFVIFFRPKYLQIRSKFELESRLWCWKKAIFGDKMKPTCQAAHSPTPNQHVAAPVIGRLGRGDMVSSLTASEGDFDHVASFQADDRWNEASRVDEKLKFFAMNTRFHSDFRISQLEVISENEESTFAAPRPPSDSRWNPTANETASASVSIPLPRRAASDFEGDTNSKFCNDMSRDVPIQMPTVSTMLPQRTTGDVDENTLSTSQRTDDTSKDIPIRMPTRRLSPTP